MRQPQSSGTKRGPDSSLPFGPNQPVQRCWLPDVRAGRRTLMPDRRPDTEQVSGFGGQVYGTRQPIIGDILHSYPQFIGIIGIEIKQTAQHNPTATIKKIPTYRVKLTIKTNENDAVESPPASYNVLKPVPQHPLEPELDFKRGLWNRYFPGGHAMSMRSIDPGRRRGSRGEEQPPWWGLGRSPRSQR